MKETIDEYVFHRENFEVTSFLPAKFFWMFLQ